MKRAGWELWVIFFYVLASFLTDFILRSSFGQSHSQQFIGVFTICEFAIFAIFFYTSIKNLLFKRIIGFTSGLVLIFLIYNFLKSNKDKFDSTLVSVESLTLIIFSVIFFFEEINKPLPYIMYRSSNFWIILAILVYMSSTLFLFIMAGNLSEGEKAKYWVINSVSSIISNIIFGIAFLQARKNNKNSAIEKSPLEFSNIPENQGN